MQEFWKTSTTVEIFVAVVIFAKGLDVYQIAFENIQDSIDAIRISRESLAYRSV